MSIFQRGKGLTGPPAAPAAQRKRLAEQQDYGADSAEPRFECRICKQQDRQGEYSPDYLAPTMEPLDRNRE